MIIAINFFSLLFSLYYPIEPATNATKVVDGVLIETEHSTSIENQTTSNLNAFYKFENFAASGSYDIEKAAGKQLRTELINALTLNQIAMDDVKTAFSNHLVNRLIPHWFGTEWSFSGHTAVPKVGQIACGYFVSTTLRDMGLRLNRYKLAQKSPIDEAKMISCGAFVTTITAHDSITVLEEINKITKEGISFIGFDEGHVGFLLKKEGELFLIHSNYIYPDAKVIMEPIEKSDVFKKFTTFHFVDISNNDQLIQRWLNGEVIQ